MNAQVQPTLDYPIISLSYARLRARGARPRTQGTAAPTCRSLALLGHEAGPAGTQRARALPRAAATGARWDARAAPGPGAAVDPAQAQGLVTRKTLGDLRRPQVRPAPPAGRESRSRGRVPSAATRERPQECSPGLISETVTDPRSGPARGRSGTPRDMGVQPLRKAPRPQAAVA
ncbi:uncharacterized protein ACIGJ3_020959 [Trichechus inunguis]